MSKLTRDSLVSQTSYQFRVELGKYFSSRNTMNGARAIADEILSDEYVCKSILDGDGVRLVEALCQEPITLGKLMKVCEKNRHDVYRLIEPILSPSSNTSVPEFRPSAAQMDEFIRKIPRDFERELIIAQSNARSINEDNKKFARQIQEYKNLCEELTNRNLQLHAENESLQRKLLDAKKNPPKPIPSINYSPNNNIPEVIIKPQVAVALEDRVLNFLKDNPLEPGKKVEQLVDVSLDVKDNLRLLINDAKDQIWQKMAEKMFDTHFASNELFFFVL